MKYIFLLIAFLVFVVNSTKINVTESKINVNIDASAHVGMFDEKVIYNLQFDNNELKSVSLKKILPKIDTTLFDVKVTSNDVKILKYELKDEKNVQDSNTNNKVLIVEFEPINKNKLKNFNQGYVQIEYQYKVNEISASEINTEKNTFYLKDFLLYDENSTFNYPTQFSINIKNLPTNIHINKIKLDNSEIKAQNADNRKVNFEFNKPIQGNTNKKSMRLSFEIENNSLNQKVKALRAPVHTGSSTHTHSSTSTHSTAPPAATHQPPHAAAGESKTNNSKSSYNTNSNSSSSSQKSYVYYTKKKKESNDNHSVIDSIISLVLILCLCYLCIQCCSSHPAEPSQAKTEDAQHAQPHENVSPDGFIYYCN